MEEKTLRRLHPVDITEALRLPDGSTAVTMEMHRMSFGGELPSNRATALKLAFTTLPGGGEDRMRCRTVLHPPPGALRGCSTAMAVLLDEEGKMNLHWRLPHPDPQLPITLVLWCVTEGRARRFALVYGSTYDCPCGEFLWDVRNDDTEGDPITAVASSTGTSQ